MKRSSRPSVYPSTSACAYLGSGLPLFTRLPRRGLLGNSGDFQVLENAPGMLSVPPPPRYRHVSCNLRLAEPCVVAWAL